MPTTTEAPYGHHHNDTTNKQVHVVAPSGWTTRLIDGAPESLWPENREPVVITSAWAMCGAGLNTPLPSDVQLRENQRWCRACTNTNYRDSITTRIR